METSKSLSIVIVSIILGWCAVNSAPFITKLLLGNIVGFAHAQSDSELNNESPSPFDVIFVARPEGEDIYVIWGSDGTEAGTQLIKNIRPGERADIGPHKGFVKVGHIFLFAANDGINGRELWRTDGTTDGTYMLKDLNGEPLIEGYCDPMSDPMCDPICDMCPGGPECEEPYPTGCLIESGSSNISDYDFVTTGAKAFLGCL
jgi:ELWxxDGT repeat protein